MTHPKPKDQAAREEEQRRFPNASDFSPHIIPDLCELLDLVEQYSGNEAALVQAVIERYFSDTAASRSPEAQRVQQVKRARNILFAAMGPNGYRLFDPDTKCLSEVGISIRQSGDLSGQLRELAKHILTNLPGLDLLRALKSIEARGEHPSKDSLNDELTRMGYRLSETTTDHTRMRQWLDAAGVTQGRFGGPSFQVNDRLSEELAGISLFDVDAWTGLSEAERAFLRVLRKHAEIKPGAELQVRLVRKQVEYEYGPQIWSRRDQIKKDVLKPLQEAGWIVLPSHEGRGAKSGVMSPSNRLMSIDIALADGSLGTGLPADIQKHLTTSLADIQRNLSSLDTHVAGLALELLAVRMAMDLTLLPLKFRERARHTGGGEVDLIAEAAHLHFSRWLFQCKNTGSVGLSTLAKELGMAFLLRANVVVLVTTGRFSRDVYAYSEQVAQSGHMQVILVDGQAVREYVRGGQGAIQKHFRSHSQSNMRLKRAQIEE